MHVPRHFAPQDTDAALDAVQRYPFGILVTAAGQCAPIATHVPFLLDRSGDEPVLLGHLARANPHVRQLTDGAPSLAVFSGPHSFVSASWYQEERSVPTWNYVAVHLSGRVELRDDHEFALQLLEQTVSHFESSAASSSWRLDAGSDYIRGLARRVVPFVLPVENVDAIFKLSQNVPADKRARVLHGITSRSSANDAALAGEMQRWNVDD